MRRVDPLADPEPLIRRVYGYAAYRLGDGPDAEDATSETFTRALRYSKTYDSAAGTPEAWLIGIARRVVGEQMAARKTHRVNEDRTVSVDNDPANAALVRLELRDALALLSKEERDLLALRYGGDLPVRDIARLLGARTNAVEVALHRTISKLRDTMSAKSSS